MPIVRIMAGIAIIMMTVNESDMPMASDNSSFFALQAAAVAMAADTPQTDMSAAITIFSDGDSIRSTLWPNQKVVTSTIGVTTQATQIPGTPNVSSLLKSTSAPSSTSPVLINSSVRIAGRTQLGVPIVLLINKPVANAHSDYVFWTTSFYPSGASQ